MHSVLLYAVFLMFLLCGCGQQPVAQEKSAPVVRTQEPKAPEVNDEPEPEPEVDGQAEKSAPAAAVPAPPALKAVDQTQAMLGGTKSHAAIVTVLREGSPRQFKPVGTTSSVFRVKLKSHNEMVALKPSSRAHSGGWRAEIAAYRIARGLGLSNVPPATYRKISREQLGHFLHRDFDEFWTDIRRKVRWTKSTTDAAAIYWLPSMRRIPIDRSPKPYRVWLSQKGNIPKDKAILARDTSNMILYDYLIGNWDRFSGGNIHGTKDGNRLYFRDHNVAFTSLTPTLHQRIHQRLQRAQKLSRSFVDSIRALTKEQVHELLKEESQRANTPILTDEQVAAVMERRQTLLSHVSALVDQYGEAAVFQFP